MKRPGRALFFVFTVVKINIDMIFLKFSMK